MYIEERSLKDDYTFLQVCYNCYSTYMLLINISDPCIYVILNDIIKSYNYLYIVRTPVTDTIYLLYTLCHMCVS